MPETRTYTGGCHCGKIRFEVKTELDRVLSCNCSICSKAGWLLAFVPTESFTLQSGAEVLSDYQFAKKRIHHLFCPDCGIHPFGRGIAPDGRDTWAVNARCLEGIDVEALAVTRFDGKSL